jgi:hypothetical protein
MRPRGPAPRPLEGSPAEAGLTVEEKRQLAVALAACGDVSASTAAVNGVLLRAMVARLPPATVLRRCISRCSGDLQDGSVPLDEGLLYRIAERIKQHWLRQRPNLARVAAVVDSSEQLDLSLDVAAWHHLSEDSGSGPVITAEQLDEVQQRTGVDVAPLLSDIAAHASAGDIVNATSYRNFDDGTELADRVRVTCSINLADLLAAVGRSPDVAEVDEGDDSSTYEQVDSDDFGAGTVSFQFAVEQPTDSGSDTISLRPDASVDHMAVLASPSGPSAEEAAFLRTVKSFTAGTRGKRLSSTARSFVRSTTPQRTGTDGILERLDGLIDDAQVAAASHRERADVFCLQQFHLHHQTLRTLNDRAVTLRSSRRRSMAPRADPLDDASSFPSPRVPADHRILTEHGVLPAEVKIGSKIHAATLQHFGFKHQHPAAPRPTRRRVSSESIAPVVSVTPSPRTERSINQHCRNVAWGRAMVAIHHAPSTPSPHGHTARARPELRHSPMYVPRPPSMTPRRPPDSPFAQSTPFARVALHPSRNSAAADCVRKYCYEALGH